MCKVFAMTNMEKVVLNKKFLNVVKNQVTKSSDKDGFGYAVSGSKGQLGGERTMRPKDFTPLTDNPGNKVVHQLPVVVRANDSFGKIDLLTPKAFIAHGRLSTNTVSLENTHPFTNGEIALIHNGVVNDEYDLVKKNLITDCDTEILLRHWEQGGMKAVEENVSGYYAFAILDKKGQLHLARDDRAMLYIAYVRTANSFMIATTADIIRGVCKAMNWKYEQPEEMITNFYCVFDGLNVVEHREIEPLIGNYSASRSAKAAAAFGYGQGWTESDPNDGGKPSYKEGWTTPSRSGHFGGYEYGVGSSAGSSSTTSSQADLEELRSSDDAPQTGDDVQNDGQDGPSDYGSDDDAETTLDAVDMIERSMRAKRTA